MQIQCPKCQEWIEEGFDSCPYCQARITLDKGEGDDGGRQFKPIQDLPPQINGSGVSDFLGIFVMLLPLLGIFMLLMGRC